MLTIDDNLSPIQPMVEEAYEKAVAADWNGDPSSEFLWSEYRRLKTKLDNGELYEEILLFHGTDEENIDNIFNNNFDINHHPVRRSKV